MKILWESDDWPGARIEQSISDLAWIPQPDRPGHGLLGVGSDTGSVGITVTDLEACNDDETRYNFNLRGHHTGIRQVTWNHAQTKLASCDASGIIYVWVRNEDRWSVELVNDRGVKVTDLSWSPCGASALICYEDNFVLIGSASGQRVWSNSYPTGPSTTVTCGVWAPDSKQLVLGFGSGNIQVLSSQGSNITERNITSEKLLKMTFTTYKKSEEWTLALLTAKNQVLMITAYDQIDAKSYQSPCPIHQMTWNSEGTILALITANNEIVMLNNEAKLMHREVVSVANKDRSLTAVTWAHDGKAVIVAAGGHLATGKLLYGVPSLFELVAYDLWKLTGCNSKRGANLPLPTREMNALKELDHHIIRCRIPRTADLCQFVCSVVDARCYCTIRPMARGSHSYVLCIEHLGGLVPVLVGRQVNRFLPQFQIMLHPNSPTQPTCSSVGSSAQVEDVNAMVRHSTGRNSLWRRSKRQFRALMSKHVRTNRPDTRLVQVTSNVWCTKFNITSLSPTNLPPFLGQVSYKTSVLHLQPRQMTIEVAQLGVGDSKEKDYSLLDHQDDRTPLVPVSTNNDEGLTMEERIFFERVLTECLSLRSAMDATSTSTAQKRKPKSHEATPTSIRTESRLEVTSMTSSTSTWHDEIEQLEFIDGDEEGMLVPSVSKPSTSKILRPFLKSAEEKRTKSKTRRSTEEKEKDADEIRAHVDKLASIAQQLSRRHADFNAKKDRASINKMRCQMKELLRRVNEIEKKVGRGDVKEEVRLLMKTLEEMKTALGDCPAPAQPKQRVVTMHNKTPFWNEHNQVYQLDFGGRVTQESAKNFQVEHDGSQVLQFGRIEGGAYTLDFKKPFSASQAFAVALASITQRLK